MMESDSMKTPPEAATFWWLRCRVVGHPKTQGSAKWIPARDGKRAIPVSNESLAAWREEVRLEVQRTLDRCFPKIEKPVIRRNEGSVTVSMLFSFRRPRSHYRTGRHAGEIKERCAGLCPTSGMDLSKLARAVEDSLTGMIYEDDSMIVREELTKRYTEGEEGLVLTIRIDRYEQREEE